MLFKGQKLVRYLYGWKNGKEFQINTNDKIILITKANKVITGEVYSIGTKYLELQVEPVIKYKPNRSGRVSSVKVERIVIDDIERIAVYPKESQRFGEKYLI